MEKINRMSFRSRIENFNIAFFGMILGLCGLVISLEKFETVFNFNIHLSYYLLFVVLFLFLVIFIMYLMKVFLNYDSLQKDWYHPTKSNFFSAFAIGFLLLSVAFLHYNLLVSKIFWLLGVFLQFFLTIFVLSKWIRHENEIKTLNPSWFIPVVGNIIVPVAGVSHFNLEVSYFFFSIGFVFWIALFTMVVNRIIFHHPIPSKLLPTLFIMIAPPAVGFIAYYRLVGELDIFARIFYFFALFIFILLVFHIGMFKKIKFFMSWWAYSFPVAALTIATFLYYEITLNIFFKYLGLVLFFVLFVLIILLLYKTINSIINKEICIDED